MVREIVGNLDFPIFSHYKKDICYSTAYIVYDRRTKIIIKQLKAVQKLRCSTPWKFKNFLGPPTPIFLTSSVSKLFHVLNNRLQLMTAFSEDIIRLEEIMYLLQVNFGKQSLPTAFCTNIFSATIFLAYVPQ